MPLLTGGGAGRHFGPGEVYVMKDVTGQGRDGVSVKMYKIGYSEKPQERLKQILNLLKPNKIVLLGSYKADESNRAETAAQTAVKDQLGMKKDSGRGNASDWFVNPNGKSDEEICSVVENAVAQHNKEMKKQQKQF